MSREHVDGSQRRRGAAAVDARCVLPASIVAGHHLLERRDLDEGDRVHDPRAGRAHGTVEMRPVWEYEQLLG